MVDPPQTLMLECHGPCHGEIDDQKKQHGINDLLGALSTPPLDT